MYLFIAYVYLFIVHIRKKLIRLHKKYFIIIEVKNNINTGI